MSPERAKASCPSRMPKSRFEGDTLIRLSRQDMPLVQDLLDHPPIPGKKGRDAVKLLGTTVHFISL